MHNWLIFQYHRVRAHANPSSLRVASSEEGPTHVGAASNGGTQEGR